MSNKINNEHPLYKEYADTWDKMRITFTGSEAVKNAGTKFLPLLDSHEHNMSGSSGYNMYKSRAIFPNFPYKTLQSFIGMANKKPPLIETQNNLDMIGNLTFVEFSNLLLSEQLQMGRCGVFVDWDDDNSEVKYTFYKTEDIINWSDDYIILRERMSEQNPTDKYDIIEVNYIRELSLEEGGVISRRYKELQWSTKLIDEVWLTVRGEDIRKIPFVHFGTGAYLTPSKPILSEIVEHSLQIYKLNADLNNGLHIVGIPIPVITGIQAGQKINTSKGINCEESDAKVYFAEVSGQGFGAINDAIIRETKNIEKLGGEIISNGVSVESAEAIRLKNLSTSNTLLGQVISFEKSLKIMLNFASQWHKREEDNVVEYNKDFIDAVAEPAMAAHILNAVSVGIIDPEVYTHYLSKGVILEDIVPSENTSFFDNKIESFGE